MPYQPGIAADVPEHSRYMVFGIEDAAAVADALERLASRKRGDGVVVGLGRSLLTGLGREIEGLEDFPELSRPGLSVPSTPAALWCWLRGSDRGALVHGGRGIQTDLAGGFHPQSIVDGFEFDGGRDLSGYEDGTENPTGDKALEVAFATGDPGIDGSSFVAVQRWRHDLSRFESFSPTERDHIIGRRLSDNQEIDDAPPTAHVKMTAQESFDPEAFVLRRSMPWADATGEGLMFVAFGKSLYAFDTLLRKMFGPDDEHADALFRFTRPMTGSYFWCPPVTGAGTLDLSALGM